MAINMKFIVLLLTIFMMANGHCGPAKPQEAQIRIRTTFNIKNSFCNIKTNGVIGLDNRKSAFEGRGLGTSSTNALLFLENGINTVSIEIGALSWFSKDNLTSEDRNTFSKDATCKLDLVSFNHNQKKTLTSIEVRIGEDGVPIGINNKGKAIIGSEIIAESVEEGHIDIHYFNKFYFPKKMKLYAFSEQVIVNNIPEWEWVNSSPYTNETEQLSKLRAAYARMAEIINSRDRKQLKKYDHIALKAWATSTGSSEDEILSSQYPEKEFETGKIKIEPISWSDYEVRVMNKGRIVQLYNKSKPTFSPLTYYFTTDEGDKLLSYFAPMFSLINGEFVPVI
ncbi:hypothetical protein [Rahnella laticis]|uniref:hypothetical protein n=1 Tax=Rahnella laticis TaxID=2787622 RepID=UPI001E38686C|nr:hypothetical protein [Rahnella laticis]